MKATIPIVIEWNNARQQWDVKWGLDRTHMQEFNDLDKEKQMFECHTFRALVKRLNLMKDKPTRVIATFEVR